MGSEDKKLVRWLRTNAVMPLAFGCEALGGYNWGDVDISAVERAACSALDQASDDCPVLFDTADTYGPHLSEQRLGALLTAAGSRALVASKFGVRLSDGTAWYDTSPEYADRALDHSLERLQRSSIDLYQLHWPDQKTPLPQTLAALEGMVAEGRIGSYGVCNVTPASVSELVGDFPNLTSLSLSYSLLERSNREAINRLAAQGVTFIAYGVLAQGLLSGKYDETSKFAKNDRRSGEKYKNFHGEALARNLKVLSVLRDCAQQLNQSVTAVAIQFVLRELPGAITLAGIKSPAQWADNLSALQVEIPKPMMKRLREVSDETCL